MRSFINQLGWAVFILFLQIFLLNYLHLWGGSTILLYVYIVFGFSCEASRVVVLFTGFLMGLCVDMFCNTPGLGAAATTLVAFLQPFYLALFTPKDVNEVYRPTMRSMGKLKYFYYVTPLILLHQLVYYGLENFTWVSWQHFGMRLGSGFLATFLFVWVIEAFRSVKKNVSTAS